MSTVLRMIGAIFVLASILAAGTVYAQVIPGAGKTTTGKVTIPKNLTSQQVVALIAKLSDQQVRQVLLEYLKHVAATNEKRAAAGGFSTRLQGVIGQMRVRMPKMIAGLGEIPTVLARAAKRMGGGLGSGHILLLIIATLGSLFVGLAADWVFRRATARFRERTMPSADVLPFAVKFGYAALRAVVELASIAVFAIAAGATFVLFFADDATASLFFRTFVVAIIIVRLIGLVARFVLSPDAKVLRFESMTDEATQRLHKSIMRVAYTWFFGIAFLTVLQDWGLSSDPHTLIKIVLGMVLIAVILFTLWTSRTRPAASGNPGLVDDGDDVSEASRGLSRHLANLWRWPAMIYLIAIFVIWLASVMTDAPATLRAAAMISLFMPPIIVYIDRAVARLLAAHARRAAEREARRAEMGTSSFETVVPPPVDPSEMAVIAALELTSSEPATDAEEVPLPKVAAGNAGNTGFYRLTHRVIRFLLILVGLFIFFRAWGIDLFASAKGAIGTRVADAVIDALGIVLVTYVIWQLIRIWIDRKIAEENAEQPDEAHEAGGEGGGAPKTRLATLLPLIRGFLFVTLVIMAFMVVLSNLGVDIGPLIAGAGVVGLAIGFGAQTLVRDIVSGMFFLIDDAFRVGEYLKVCDLGGTVEKISIRSMRLRHHRGLVHTVPYGNINSVTNFSRDWVIMKLEFRLPHGTDIEKVRKLIKKIGQEMAEDPELSKGMLAPLKSQGVTRVEDSALIFRAKFMAKPGEQFVLRREAYRKIQEVLAANGIHFAHSKVTVEIANVDKIDPEDAEAIAKAAGAAAVAKPKPA